AKSGANSTASSCSSWSRRSWKGTSARSRASAFLSRAEARSASGPRARKWHTAEHLFLSRSDVRFGSSADISQCNRRVRFTPKADVHRRQRDGTNHWLFGSGEKMKHLSPHRNSGLAVILFATALIILWGNAAMAMTLNSPAFQQNDHIPSKYTCEGEDVSPPLAWE